MALKNYRLLFFGSHDFSLPILDKLISDGWIVSSVITQPDRPKGRSLKLTPTRVKLFARERKIEFRDWPSLKLKEVESELREFKADFAIVAAYGQLIPVPILKVCRKGFLNVHPSLLPKYRGPSPIQFAILNGERETGVSIIVMDEQLDHGPILAQEKLAMENLDTFTSLQDRLARSAAELLSQNLSSWITGMKDVYKQDDRKATYTKLLTRNDGKINWKKTADEIDRQVRAFTPWPGTWTNLDGERLKMIEVKSVDFFSSLVSGGLKVVDSRLYAGCGNSTTLELRKLQPEGKSIMTADSFIRGRPKLDQSVLQ